MKGILASPFHLQVVILFFGGFYMLALSSQYGTLASTRCRYEEVGHSDDKSTNGEYGILCIGNSITR